MNNPGEKQLRHTSGRRRPTDEPDEGMGSPRSKAHSYIIKRPRLTKLLDESEARIILLCAPAGYGKTTLAREWVEGSGIATAFWHSCHPTDADVAGLAAALADVLSDGSDQNAASDRVRELAGAAQPISALARAVADGAPENAVLVVDDYHFVGESEPSDALFTEFLRLTSLRIVVSSRQRPRWLSGRAQLYGDVVLLEAEQLRFTDAEANEVLAALSVEEGARVISAAQGWPAVIGMAPVLNQVAAVSEGIAPRALYDFFVEEVFGRAEKQVQRGLFELASGADATYEVARAVLAERFEATFNRAADLGFITRGSVGIGIHPLLREFLQTRLEDAGEESVSAVLESVVPQLIARGLWDDCLTTLQRFPVRHLVTAAVRAAMHELLAAGRVATLKQWLDLASSLSLEEPCVLLAEAEIALREGREDYAQTLAERAAALSQTDEDAGNAYLTAARAAHLKEEASAAATLAERATMLVTDRETKVEALWIAFAASLEQQDPGAHLYLDALRQLGGDDPRRALRLACAEGLYAHESGRTAEAVDVLGRAEALLAHIHNPLQKTGYLNLFAHVVFCAAQYERALELVDRQVSEATSSSLDFPMSYALVTRASVLTSTRRLLDARRALAALEKAGSLPAHVAGNAIICSAKLRIAAGNLEGASVLLNVDAPAGSRPPFVGELLAFRGMVAASQGYLTEAEEAFKEAEATSRYIDAQMNVTLGRAIAAHRAAGPGANDGVRAAAHAIFEAGCGEVLVTACRAYPQIVAVGAEDHRLARKFTNLLIASRDGTLGRKGGLPMPREISRREELTPRQEEIFELMAQGMSNVQIANTLFIDLTTAKTHVRHIFQKLGVHSRAEAAALYAGREN